MNYENYIGCAIQYENKSGILIETDLDAAKAKYFNNHPETIKNNTFRAYKKVEQLSTKELEAIFGQSICRLNNCVKLKKSLDVIDGNVDVDVTELYRM